MTTESSSLIAHRADLAVLDCHQDSLLKILYCSVFRQSHLCAAVEVWLDVERVMTVPGLLRANLTARGRYLRYKIVEVLFNEPNVRQSGRSVHLVIVGLLLHALEYRFDGSFGLRLHLIAWVWRAGYH